MVASSKVTVHCPTISMAPPNAVPEPAVVAAQSEMVVWVSDMLPCRGLPSETVNSTYIAPPCASQDLSVKRPLPGPVALATHAVMVEKINFTSPPMIAIAPPHASPSLTARAVQSEMVVLVSNVLARTANTAPP